MKKLLSILALALCFVACQNEPNVNATNGDLVDVVLNIEAPELGITRAGDNGQDDSKNAKDSAYGAIDYADAAFWAENDLRYILEVYAEGDSDGSEGPIARERLVNCLDAYAPTEFKLRLVPNRTYKFVVFADFVAEGSRQLSNPLEIADVYYDTTDLTAITSLTGGTQWNAMNEARDAYFISQNVNVTTGLTQSLILTRPFAKVRVVTTDILDLEKYATPAKVVVTYYNHPIFKSFNAVNGAISTEMTGDELTHVVEYNGQYNAGYDSANYPSHMTLYADYIHAIADQQSNINFRMDVYDQSGRLLKSNDFSTEIPVQRNHLTTLMGNVLTTEATIQILISDEFAGYYEYEVPEGIFDNDTIVVTGFENGGTFANGAYSYNVSNTTTGDSFTLNVKDSALTNGTLAEGEYNYGTDFTATDVMVNVTRAAVAATAEGGKMVVDIDDNGKYAIAIDLVAKTAAGDAFYPSFGFYGDFVIKAVEILAAPANFVGTVEGENVTFTWSAVENATSYEVVFNGITASISEGTTATFTVQATDEEQTLAASIVAKAEGYLDSEAATCVVVIPAKVIIPTYNIYFNNLAEWAEVYAHIWANEGENIGLEDVNWPGRKLTETETIEGVTYYVFHLPEEATGKTVNVVFNNGQGAQTKDLAGVATGDLFFDNYVEPVEPSDVVIYMKPNANWKTDGARFAAYFFNNGETWSDMTLVEGETDIYAVTVPTGFVDVIFCRMNPNATENNWNNKWNQTADLKVPTDGTNLYTVTEGAWDNGEGTWSTYTVATEPEEPEQPEVVYTSVADFLAAEEDDTTIYTLKGTITRVANTTYGNFDLTDDTGTVYIYGLCSPEGEQKYWATSGAKLGDDIVVKTKRSSFNSTPQGEDAIFVELLPGTRAFFTIDTAAVEFASAGGEQTIKVAAYNTDAAVSATSDNAVFAVSVNGYEVVVAAAANELEEKVEGNITIKVGDLDAVVVSATLAAKPTEGTVEGGSDDFHTITNTNTSYVSGKTTAGWSYANCAIFKGGTSDSSPTFKMFGDESNRALCMNGKTSAVGSITSPTLTTGCGTLKFNYGLPFSDSKIKFRVDIKQNGVVVETFTIENLSAAKNTVYTREEVINVTGDFQIVFTNLSPSNNTGNKDRTAIWDVEWTGCN